MGALAEVLTQVGIAEWADGVGLLEEVLEATASSTPKLDKVLEQPVAPIRVDWRTLLPTEKQLVALRNLGEKRVPQTRGEASEWINAHGKRINEQRKAARKRPAPAPRKKVEPCGCDHF